MGGNAENQGENLRVGVEMMKGIMDEKRGEG